MKTTTDWEAIDALDNKVDDGYDGASIAALKAVIAVESNGRGCLPDGRPKILVERHKAWKYAQAAGLNPAQLSQGNEDILGPTWDKSYYKGGAGEYERLERLRALVGDDIANSATSWGIGQVLGSNHAACKYPSVADFVTGMEEGEHKQIEAMLEFCRSKNLWKYLQGNEPDFASFARGYNGTAYRKNQYDKKLWRAYRANMQDLQADFAPATASRTNWGAIIAKGGIITSGASQIAEHINAASQQTQAVADAATQAANAASAIANNAEAIGSGVAHIWQSFQALSVLGLIIALCGTALVMYARWDDRQHGIK